MNRALTGTYRLQLRNGVGFAEAAAAAPYLAELGASHLYASPILAASTGSTHGYDVVDPTRLDPALGDRAAFEGLVAELARHGLGLALDIVPNHLSATVENPWWRDLLAHGRASAYEPVFDVDWEAPGLEGRILLPLLDAPVEEAVAAGAVTVDAAAGVVRVGGGLELPLAPGTETLAEQHYALAPWRSGGGRVNYRRFFDINDLAAARVEDPWVFDLTHDFLLELVHAGLVHGLRVDHVDGLREPLGYLTRLREAVGPEVPIWVEKIVGPDESLPVAWPVQGTTGYEVAAAAVDALVDRDGVVALEDAYHRRTGLGADFATVAAGGKRLALRELAHGDTDRVARALAGPLGRTPEELAFGLEEAVVALHVYRTYVRPDGTDPADRDRIAHAVPGDEPLRRALTGDPVEALEGALRFQQLSVLATAKGVEDTALYRYRALLARNEVGAHPGDPPAGPAGLHRLLGARAVTTPSALTGVATHDTKRGPDVRARLLALAEAPALFDEAVDELLAADGVGEVEPADSWFLWQTLVGAWPLDPAEHDAFAGRVRTVLVKSAREAKLRTSWMAPDAGYEAALEHLVDHSLDPAAPLRPVLERVVEAVAWPGAVTGLGLALLAVAAPGVPDVYQGTERWALSLVDPDNRRPVDLSALAADLGTLADADVAEVLEGWRDGRLKQLVLQRALEARAADPDLFARGDYHPLHTDDDVLAFARQLDDRAAVFAMPRSPLRRPPAPTELVLPHGPVRQWTDVLTRTALDGPVAFATLPVALLLGSREAILGT